MLRRARVGFASLGLHARMSKFGVAVVVVAGVGARLNRFSNLGNPATENGFVAGALADGSIRMLPAMGA